MRRRPSIRPAIASGVLVIDAVEISTNGGHYVALDMPPAPYPLGGQADAVVEDVARLGGFGIAAHPGSIKSELAWKAWAAPIDGLEWLSLDSEWRDESRARLAAVASRYLFRRGPAVASLLDRPVDVMGRWDAETARRSVLGIAGHDAHGGPLEGGGGRMASVLGIPSYEAAFRAFGIRAVVSSELTGRASDDAALVVGAIRRGRVFTAVDAVAGPAFVDYRATAGGESATMGETLPFERDARLTVRATVPEGGRVVALRDGREFAESASGELDAAADRPGAYRIEIRAPASPGTPPVPWIVTNPIYLRGQATESGLREQEYSTVTAVQASAAIEKDPGSTATLSSSGPQVALDYALRSGGSGEPIRRVGDPDAAAARWGRCPCLRRSFCRADAGLGAAAVREPRRKAMGAIRVRVTRIEKGSRALLTARGRRFRRWHACLRGRLVDPFRSRSHQRRPGSDRAIRNLKPRARNSSLTDVDVLGPGAGPDGCALGN